MDITPTSQSVSGKNAQARHEHRNLLEGIHFKFPTFKHEHPAVIDVNAVADEQMTVGQKVADRVAAAMGSWRFIIIQSTFWLSVAILNIVAIRVWKWDQYPFIRHEFSYYLSSGICGPVMMMSQNRQSEKDRLTAQNDYLTDCKGEEEIRFIMNHLDHQDTVILQLVQRIEEQHQELKEHLARFDPTLAQRLGIDAVKISQELIEEDSEMTGNS